MSLEIQGTLTSVFDLRRHGVRILWMGTPGYKKLFYLVFGLISRTSSLQVVSCVTSCSQSVPYIGSFLSCCLQPAHHTSGLKMRRVTLSVHNMLFYGSVVSLSFSMASAATFNACPLLGAVYPAPTSISTSSVIQSALSNLTDALDTLIATGNSTDGPFVAANITTWSIGMFSTSDEFSDPFWQYHYTAPLVANSTAGVHKADMDSVYRVGSISKLFTVYSLLVQAGDGYWQDPVTKWVPELAAIAAGDAKEGVEDIARIRWEDVTLGDLANQLAGLPRDCMLLDLRVN